MMANGTHRPAVAAVIGGGVIGGGWVARLIQNGVHVRVFDPDPEAPRKIAAIMDNADKEDERRREQRHHVPVTAYPRGRCQEW